MSMIVGSQEWCDYWAEFHLRVAERRLKTSELLCWHHLLEWQLWKHTEPWH